MGAAKMRPIPSHHSPVEVPMHVLLSVVSLALSPSAHASDTGAPGQYWGVVSDITTVNAVSGLAAIRGEPNGNGHDDEVAVWAVGDRAVVPSRIFGATVGNGAVELVSELYLTLDGQQVSYDLEGIDVDPAGGWWLAVEGGGNAPTASSANRLLHVDPSGAITEVVSLPASVAAQQRQYGFEGVASNDDGSQLYVAFQGEWGDDPSGYLRIGRYTPATGEWAFYHYPRNFGSGRVGLSEITWAGNDTLILLERDNLVTGAWDKRLYTVSVAGLTPAPAGSTPPVLSPVLFRDFLAVDGWPFEKAEGVAIVDRDVVIVNDNDGVTSAVTEALVLEKLAKDLE